MDTRGQKGRGAVFSLEVPEEPEEPRAEQAGAIAQTTCADELLPMSAGERRAQAVMAVDVADPTSRAQARKLVDALGPGSPSSAKSRMLDKRILALAQADSGSSRVVRDLQLLANKVRELDALYVRPRRQGLFGKLFGRGAAEQKTRDPRETLDELEDLVTSLVGSAEVLRQNSVALDGYDADITEESERVAADIEQADDFEAALVAAIDKAKREGADPAKVHFVENEVLFPLEHQRQYLQSLLAVNQQAALSLSILRETNVALINNVRIITLATKHSVGIAKTLRSFSAGGGASPVGTPSSTPGMAALEASIDDLFAAFERHDLWHAEVAAKTQEAVGELQDLTEKVFDGTPHGYHHR